MQPQLFAITKQGEYLAANTSSIRQKWMKLAYQYAMENGNSRDCPD